MGADPTGPSTHLLSQRYWIPQATSGPRVGDSLTVPETPVLSEQLGTQLERRKHLLMN